MIKSGTRDPRRFRHFVKLAADGSVAGVLETASGAPPPTDAAGSVFVEVTDLHPYDFTDVTVRVPQRPQRPVPPMLVAVKDPDPPQPKRNPATGKDELDPKDEAAFRKAEADARAAKQTQAAQQVAYVTALQDHADAEKAWLADVKAALAQRNRRG